MNQGNMPNNQNPTGNVPVNNTVPNNMPNPNGVVNNGQAVASNVNQQVTMQQSVTNSNAVSAEQVSPAAQQEVNAPAPQQNMTASQNTINTANVQQVPPVDVPPAPVPPSDAAASVVTDSNVKAEEHEVSQVLASTFENKEKVNLLTPEQKAELEKKREQARLEKENYQPKPVGKFQKFFMTTFIIALFAIMFFLPEIDAFLATIKKDEVVESEVITSGVLKCTEESVGDIFNVNYTYEFTFESLKLKKLSYYEVTIGNEVADSEELKAKLSECQLLKSMTSTVTGVNVACSLSSGNLTREQIFDYTVINPEQASTAYIEAGGDYPGQFSLNANIDSLEKNMKADGYNCVRQK